VRQVSLAQHALVLVASLRDLRERAAMCLCVLCTDPVQQVRLLGRDDASSAKDTLGLLELR
jgi:hypothetical protein